MTTHTNNKKRSETSLEEPGKWKKKKSQNTHPSAPVSIPWLARKMPNSQPLLTAARRLQSSEKGVSQKKKRVQRRAETGSEVTKTGARKTSESGLGSARWSGLGCVVGRTL
jgi:hypothetical protein